MSFRYSNEISNLAFQFQRSFQTQRAIRPYTVSTSSRGREFHYHRASIDLASERKISQSIGTTIQININPIKASSLERHPLIPTSSSPLTILANFTSPTATRLCRVANNIPWPSDYDFFFLSLSLSSRVSPSNDLQCHNDFQCARVRLETVKNEGN